MVRVREKGDSEELNRYKIGEVLKKLRKERGLTQDQLANEVGLSKTAIFQYENNKREPNFEAMSKLGSYFNVSPQYLAGKSGFKSLSEQVYRTSEIDLEKIVDELPEGQRKQTHSVVNNFNSLLEEVLGRTAEEEKLLQLALIRDTLHTLSSLFSGKYLPTKEFWVNGMLSELDFYISIKKIHELRMSLLEQKLESYFNEQARSHYTKYRESFDSVGINAQEILDRDAVSKEIRSQLLSEYAKSFMP